MTNNEYGMIIREMTEVMKKAFYRPDKYDHTYIMKVVEVIDASHYRVNYNGGLRKATSSIPLNIDDNVWVCAPCNNWDNLFVVCKTR